MPGTLVEGDFDWYKITFPFNRSIIKSTNKTTNKNLDDIGVELLDLLKSNPNLSMVEIGTKLKISSYTVQYHINKLKKKGKIIREGSKKTGLWVVK